MTTQMFQIRSWSEEDETGNELLAIMPMATMQVVLGLRKEVVQRIDRETATNNGWGVCAIFLGSYYVGFGNRVMVGRCAQWKEGD